MVENKNIKVEGNKRDFKCSYCGCRAFIMNPLDKNKCCMACGNREKLDKEKKNNKK